jgi:Thiol:disulfide interchange protein DsbD, N-terminal
MSAGVGLRCNLMHRMIVAILALFLVAAAESKRPPFVTITPAEQIQINQGKIAEYPLELRILKGYHIQANPASEPYLIATRVTVEPIEAISVAGTDYPKGIPFQLKGSKKSISTYEDKAKLIIRLQTNSAIAPGEKILKGKVRYQACDAIMCYPPTTLPFDLKVQVIK